MRKMASSLCRSRDVFLKCTLIGQPKNCLTNCIKQCDSQKIDIFSQKCCCEVPIWKNNTTSQRNVSLPSCSHGKDTQSTYHATLYKNSKYPNPYAPYHMGYHISFCLTNCITKKSFCLTNCITDTSFCLMNKFLSYELHH